MVHLVLDRTRPGGDVVRTATRRQPTDPSARAPVHPRRTGDDETMVTEILILSHLLEGPLHGYDIKRNVRRPDLGRVKNNAVYSTLARLRASGSLESRTEAAAGRPDRQVFSLTEKGRQRLLDRIVDLPASRAGDDEEFYVRFALLDLVDAPARARILRARLDALETKISIAQEYLDGADGGAELPRHAGAMFAHLHTMLLSEKRWVTDFALDAEGDVPRHP